MLKVIVNRDQWIRGDNGGLSALRRKHDGKMCCLGFAALAAGLTEEQITDCGYPCTVLSQKRVAELPEALLPLVRPRPADGNHWTNDPWLNSEIGSELARTNDKLYADNFSGDRVTDAEREAALITLGRQAGIEFEFVNSNSEAVAESTVTQ